jgi:hypothetical protein
MNLPNLNLTIKASLALDCLSSSNHLALLRISCSYMTTNWKLREALSESELIEGSHTGLNFTRIVIETLIRHDLTDRLSTVTADNASNNVTLRSSLKVSLCSLNVA